MCGFCQALENESKEITWHVRSVYADDNVCEYINGYDTKVAFKLNSYNHDGKIIVGVEYRQEINSRDNEKIIISPFSEMIQFNFCPICGKQISKEIKDFENYYSHQIDIDDK
jgi:hypothetical protein